MSEIPGCEREVSVCFVDLQGYTRHTEANAPAEVSRFLMAYFRVVAEVVREHGGSVVELQGDGIVVAFGIHGEHPDKERRALRAAREILTATRELGLVVRIGVATGRGWVGRLRVLDWSAFCVVGAPTVLAARLQHVAETLRTSLAADGRTLEAVGEATGFELHRSVAIRGSSRRHDVYGLCEEETSHPKGMGLPELQQAMAALFARPQEAGSHAAL